MVAFLHIGDPREDSLEGLHHCRAWLPTRTLRRKYGRRGQNECGKRE